MLNPIICFGSLHTYAISKRSNAQESPLAAVGFDFIAPVASLTTNPLNFSSIASVVIFSSLFPWTTEAILAWEVLYVSTSLSKDFGPNCFLWSVSAATWRPWILYTLGSPKNLTISVTARYLHSLIQSETPLSTLLIAFCENYNISLWVSSLASFCTPDLHNF